MKKITYFLLALLAVSCMKDEIDFIDAPIDSKLEILALEGLKFQGSDITDGSLWNFKTLSEGYDTKVDALVDSMGVTDNEVSTSHRRRDLDSL